jgi:hypothetical protein
MPVTTLITGPAPETSGAKTACCGDPTNTDGGAHPWVHVSEDGYANGNGPGDLYVCSAGCGAKDVD